MKLPERKKNIDHFIRHLLAKMEKGEKEHGRSTGGEIKEIENELLDICGWAFVRWERLQKLTKTIDQHLADWEKQFDKIFMDISTYNESQQMNQNIICDENSSESFFFPVSKNTMKNFLKKSLIEYGERVRDEQKEKDAQIVEEENEEKYAGHTDPYDIQELIAKEVRNQSNE